MVIKRQSVQVVSVREVQVCQSWGSVLEGNYCWKIRERAKSYPLFFLDIERRCRGCRSIGIADLKHAEFTHTINSQYFKKYEGFYDLCYKLQKNFSGRNFLPFPNMSLDFFYHV